MKAIEMFPEFFAQREKDFQVCDYGGKRYALTQDAYAAYDSRYPDDECYHACAVCGDDEVDENGEVNCYEVTWIVTEQGKADMEATDDESLACEWDKPVDVLRTGGYDIALDCCC